MRSLAPPALAALIGLAGCASPPTTILTLDATAPSTVESRYRGPPIAIPAVHVPAALDRTAFARQASAGRIDVDDFAQWAAPLGLLARDALVRDLTARLPAGTVLAPGSTGGAGARVIDVTILSIDANGARATMQVAWRRLPGGTTRLRGFDAPLAGPRPADAAQAFGALIGQFADALAADQVPAG